MTEGERIRYLVDHCCGGSMSAFANSIGIDKTRLSRIVNDHPKYRINKLIPVILAVYPEVNPDWLRTGEGDPGALSVADIKAKYEAIIREQNALIRTLQMVIEEKLNETADTKKIAPDDQQSANGG